MKDEGGNDESVAAQFEPLILNSHAFLPHPCFSLCAFAHVK